MILTLRDYQSAMLDRAREHMRAGKRRVLLVAPTGAGKRIMACHTIAAATERGKRSVMLVHRQELLDQASETLAAQGVEHGIIKAGYPEQPHLSVQLASVQSLVRRMAGLRAPDFLFGDESHHIPAAQFAQVFSAWPSAYVLGFTATPQRLDGRGLAAYFDAMVVGPSVRECIAQGYLADYRMFAPTPPDLSGIRVRAGDYAREQLAAAVDQPTIVGDVVEHYRRIAPGRQALVFAVNIEHSLHLARAFWAAGIEAHHADGTTPRDERRAILANFAARRFRVLCSVDILGEGLDVAGIEAVILARPTRSLTVYLQQVGRGLRVKPDGSKCIILDHANNYTRHGLPDDDREWQLTEGRQKRAASDNPVKTCTHCFAVVPAAVRDCPECGCRFEGEPRRIRQSDGTLQEIDRTAVARQRKMANRQARSFDQLVALGRARGYRYPQGWAKHVLAGRRS